MSAIRALKPAAAPRPEPRTVSVEGKGRWAGWRVRARADFPAQVAFDLTLTDTSDVEGLARVFATFDRLVIEHNLPDMDGNIARRLADVDPKEGAVYMLGEVLSAISALPPL